MEFLGTQAAQAEMQTVFRDIWQEILPGSAIGEADLQRPGTWGPRNQKKPGRTGVCSATCGFLLSPFALRK